MFWTIILYSVGKNTLSSRTGYNGKFSYIHFDFQVWITINNM